MVAQENKKKETFEEWYNKIVFCQYKLILPNGRSFNKLPYVTNNGFNNEKMNDDLKKYFNSLK